MNRLSNSSDRIGSLILAVIFALLSCLLLVDISKAKQVKEDSPYFNEELSQLSYGLALLDANAAFIDKLDCFVAREIKPNFDKSDQGETGGGRDDVIRFLESKNQEEREWCDIFADVARDTKDIAATALQSKTVPVDGFLFYARRSESLFEDEYSKEHKETAVKLGKFPPSADGEPVGLFKTLDQCRAAEGRLRKLDNLTRPCRSWAESWFAKAEASKPEEIERRREAAHKVDWMKTIWAAVRQLVSLGVLILVYSVSRHMFSDPSIRSGQGVKDYVRCTGAVAVVSLVLWATYGTHFERGDDYDPLHGTGGQWVQDFKPTDKERNEHGIEMFLLLLVPAWFGVRSAHKAAPLYPPQPPRLEEGDKQFDRAKM